jgi:glutamate synthase (NADPH/NADH) large chain
VGVCTQDEDLRAKFTGSAEKVVNLITFYAQEVREVLASIGARSLDEVIGRADLLTQVSRGSAHLDDLDLNPMLITVGAVGRQRLDRTRPRNEVPDTLDAEIVRDAARFLNDGEKMQLHYSVQNTHRSVGTRVSSHIVRRFGMRNSLQPDHLTVKLTGSAGQSLGAFAAPGLKIEVSGDANDYVGKGLSGATIVVRPPMASPLVAHENTIIGNTVLYGATGGYLFAAGRAGERFAVRNSGAKVVVEGCGSNGCEYMTGGVAVILGEIGANFGAGMTGGMAYIHDPDGRTPMLVNGETLVACKVAEPHWEAELKGLIERHLAETGSRRAQDILRYWDRELPHFVQLCPREMLGKLAHPLGVTPEAIPAESGRITVDMDGGGPRGRSLYGVVKRSPYSARSTFFCTLPMVLRGSASSRMSLRGCLNRASEPAAASAMASRSGTAPFSGTMNPTTVSPKSGCGTPTTALSSTPG